MLTIYHSKPLPNFEVRFIKRRNKVLYEVGGKVLFREEVVAILRALSEGLTAVDLLDSAESGARVLSEGPK